MKRRAFTLVEILVVLGIMAVLAAIAVTSMGRVLESQKRTETKGELANAKSMFADYDAATSLKVQPIGFSTGGGVTPPAELDFWTIPTRNPNARGGAIVPIQATDPMDTRTTQIVMGMITKTGNAKSTLSHLPKDSVRQLPLIPAGNGLPPVDAAPILLDAWQNPIIFVPAAGLGGVTLNGKPGDASAVTRIITSGGTQASIPPTQSNLFPGARPFFASAGPDGSFVTGDDNLYSFE